MELNKGLSRGVVLKARVDGLWDERREVYLSELMSNAQDRVKLIALESVNFQGLLLAATHKKYGDRLKRYLQTGNEAELGTGMFVDSIKQYKDVVEMLTKITGQDKKNAAQGSGTVSVNVTPGEGGTPTNVSVRWTPEQADAIRAVLEAKDGNT